MSRPKKLHLLNSIFVPISVDFRFQFLTGPKKWNLSRFNIYLFFRFRISTSIGLIIFVSKRPKCSYFYPPIIIEGPDNRFKTCINNYFGLFMGQIPLFFNLINKLFSLQNLSLKNLFYQALSPSTRAILEIVNYGHRQ